jgi:hypothetical protein
MNKILYFNGNPPRHSTKAVKYIKINLIKLAMQLEITPPAANDPCFS